MMPPGNLIWDIKLVKTENIDPILDSRRSSMLLELVFTCFTS